MWIPRESKDPVVLHHPGRESIGYFGAVRLRDGKFLFQREDEAFNGQSFFTFLKSLRKITAPVMRKTVLIIDNAKYHHAKLHQEWRMKAENAFSLAFLPPYSPDLNPIERVWKLTRRLAVHNQYFPSPEEIAASVEDVFMKWRSGSDSLRRLCAIN
jgi:transposase